MWKKLVSLNLAILLLFGMFPMGAGAATGNGVESPLTRAGMCQKVAEAFDPPYLAEYGKLESPFPDVTKDMPEYSAIMYCYQAGMVSNYQDGKFCPQNTFTRWEIAMILFGMAGRPEGHYPEVIPSDLSSDQWYYDDCCAALDMGLMKVGAEGKFRPDASVYPLEINWATLAEYKPQSMTYHGSDSIAIKFGENVEISFSDFCNEQGSSLNLDASSAVSSHIVAGEDISLRWYNDTLSLGDNYPSAGSIGMLTAKTGGKQYQMPILIGLPEFGLYHTSPVTSADTVFANIKQQSTVSYGLDKTVYLMPADSGYTCAAATAETNAENLTVTLEENGKYVSIAVKPNVTGDFTAQLSTTWQHNGGNPVTKEFWLDFTDEAKLYHEGSGYHILYPGDEARIQPSLRSSGAKIKKRDGFTFRLKNIPGKTFWRDDGFLYIQVDNQAKIGSQGQLVATKGGVSYTLELGIYKPYLGFYSDSQGTDENFLGSVNGCFIDISKYSSPPTVYLVCEYAGDPIREITFKEEDPPFTAEVAEDGSYAKLTLKSGRPAAKAAFYVHRDYTQYCSLTFAEGTALMASGGKFQWTRAADNYAIYTSLFRVDTGEQIDQTYRLGIEGKVGAVKWVASQVCWTMSAGAVPGATGRITATKNGVTYYIPVQITLPDIGIYRAPQATLENALGETVNFAKDPSLKTVYIVPTAESSITSFSNVNVDDWYRERISVSLGPNGKYIKVTLKDTSDHDIYAFFSYKAQYADGNESDEYQSLRFTDGTKLRWRSGTEYYSEKNLIKLTTWDGTPVDDSYTVTLKKNGISADWQWVDSDMLLWDASKLGPKDASDWVLTAKKGGETFSYDFYLSRPDFSAFSQPIYDDQYFLHGPSRATDYSKGQRTVYIYSYMTSFGDMCLFTEAHSDNEQIEVSLVDNCQAMEVSLNPNATGAVSVNISYRTEDTKPNTFDTLHVSFKADSTVPATEGVTSDGVAWEIDNGTLNLTGGDQIGNYASAMEWSEVKDQVTSVSISDGVTNIGVGAFKDFGKLETVTVPSTVTAIDKNAFAGCESLKVVEIPAAVQSIDPTAFEGCDGVTIHGDAGDTYAETFAMAQNIAYESESEAAESTGDLTLDVGKVVSVSGRVAVAAVVENGTNETVDGNIVAGIYYEGRLVSCAVLDKNTGGSIKSRAVLQLPYTLKDVDPDQIDVQVMYLDKGNAAPLAVSAESDTINACMGV